MKPVFFVDRNRSNTGAQSLRRCAGKRITSRIESFPSEHHREPVDAEAEPAGRRHAVRERLDVVLVARLGLDVAAGALLGLHPEPLLLLDRRRSAR